MAFLFSIGSFCSRSWFSGTCVQVAFKHIVLTQPRSECKTFLPDMLSCFNAAETQKYADNRMIFGDWMITNVGSSGIAREMPSIICI